MCVDTIDFCQSNKLIDCQFVFTALKAGKNLRKFWIYTLVEAMNPEPSASPQIPFQESLPVFFTADFCGDPLRLLCSLRALPVQP